MYGAIAGDIIGSETEFDPIKTKDFELFTSLCGFTDDTVMTVALMEALLECGRNPGREKFEARFVASMQSWGRRYPGAGYGGTFYDWIFAKDPAPYNSWGNGSAMRVSPAGWWCDSLEDTLRLATWSAEVTHNHPEGIKGAKSVAASIFLARTGHSKEDIKEYVTSSFGYDLDTPLEVIRPSYRFDVSCQGSVPQSIRCFLEGTGYVDTVRNAVSLGGDSDTMGAISGSIAEAFWGVPQDIVSSAGAFLTSGMIKTIDAFYREIS